MKLMMIRTYFGLSSIFNPEKTAEKSFNIFQKVRRKDIREREIPFYQQARKFQILTDTNQIDCFELGDPSGPLVFLVHGWESNAGSMSQLAQKFSDKRFRVIAFNLPGHAFYKASHTNLLECKRAMMAVMEFVDPKAPFSVVAHSFGSAVAANALADSQREVKRMVFLTNPNKMLDVFMDFKETIGLRNKAYRALIRNTSQILGAPIQSLDVSANLKKVRCERLLLIHDEHDKVLPHLNSFQINSDHQNVQLISLEKVGHYKMLWTDEVTGRAVSFIEGKEVL